MEYLLKIRKLHRALLGLFYVAIVLFLATFSIHHHETSQILWLMCLFSILAFVVFTGLLAHAFDRSVFLWVAGTLLFAPLSFSVVLYRTNHMVEAFANENA